jgi:hypothetical protein
MKPGRYLILLAVLLLLLGLLSAGVHTFTRDNTLGTDFYVFWQAGRGFLLDYTSPYSVEFALRSQMAIFKRPAAPGEDQLGFAYLPFSILAILPLLFLPFDWASAVWLALLILSWAAAVFLITRRAPQWPGLLIAAFYPAFFGLVLGNFVSLAAALLAVLAGLYLFTERPTAAPQILAGAAAAFLLVKPQFSWLYVAILLLHGLRRRQWLFLAAAVVGALTFVLVSFWIWPPWPGEWLAEVNRYASYNQTWPTLLVLLRDLLPENWTIVLGGIGLVAVMIATLFYLFRWWFGYLPLLPLLAWTGLAAYLVHPHGKSYEHLVFLVPLLIWVCRHPQRLSLGVQAWWLGSLAISWLAFALSFSLPALGGVTEWPVLVYAAWVAWLWRRDARKIEIDRAAC